MLNHKHIYNQKNEGLTRLVELGIIVLAVTVRKIEWGRDEALLHKMEKFRGNICSSNHMSENQGLQLKLLPLGRAKVASHS